ncbi:MAG: selenocysteine-specific translation elongation factor [Actinomycetia bacterium]|nr:selenocysteine-specific translation elongation factor [Actinomycetes bacterium]
MPIVATAGHVDHGKSTLVEALTGRDPDRWAEEKQRGLTIDLGFAWTDIDGQAVGFVDVPGHERFIKNMLAGVGAVDCALLVIAADSGWMPQTEEHAAVLGLLETRNGVIALTRTDLVDADTVELATLEILEEIEGTPLETWPIVPVSATSGRGLDQLRSEIGARLTTSPPDEGPFRMWIDRSFTIRGAGLVVTGSIAGGSLSVDDSVEVLPVGLTTRVRGIHRHDTSVLRVGRGDRAAINLVAGSATDIERGHLLVTPGSAATTSRFLGWIRPARIFAEVPKRGGFHIHIGTADTSATIRRVPETDGYIVATAEPIPAAVGDRFILRDSGRRSVVGGGRVLDPGAGTVATSGDVLRMEAVLDASPDVMADALVDMRGITNAATVVLETGGGRPSAALVAGANLVSAASVLRIETDVEEIVSGYHTEYPLRPGIHSAELATRLQLDDAITDAVVIESDRFDSTEGAVHLKGFSNSLTPDQQARWIPVRALLEETFDVPRMSALKLPEELLHALLRQGDLVQIDDDLAFTYTQLKSITADVRDLPDGFSVSAFKEHFGMTRRQAIPTLEWLDRSGVTRREGDGRVARRKPS